MVKTAGRPPPTVTWSCDGRKVEGDYSTEFKNDGSLMLVSAEMKHAGTYTFTVSNSVGSVEGCTKLVVHTEDEEHANRSTVESNPVITEKFGEYVSGFHAQQCLLSTVPGIAPHKYSTSMLCMMWYTSELWLFSNFRLCPLERKVTRQQLAKSQLTGS